MSCAICYEQVDSECDCDRDRGGEGYGRTGRVELDEVGDMILLPGADADADYYLCGPVAGHARGAEGAGGDGVGSGNGIHSEDFGAGPGGVGR